MLIRMMNFLVLSCKEATELVEKKQIIGLSLKEKTRLKVHLWICSACRSYEKQSRLMDRMLEHMVNSTKKELQRLDDSSKKKILQRIKDSN